MIDKQETEYEYEVICVDSGSTDDTVDIIKTSSLYFKTKLTKTEFWAMVKHENLGASLGTGEYIIFITQDALPYDTHWIQNFIDGMKSDPEIVGGFGKHYPYPDCNIFDKRDLTLLFQGYGTTNTIYQLDDKERYKNEEGYRHLLAFLFR